MPNTSQLNYGSSGQSVPITLTSVTSGQNAISTPVSNATNLYLDVLIRGKITVLGPRADYGKINVYIFATVDGGTTYTAGCDGMASPSSSLDTAEKTNLILLGSIVVLSTVSVYTFGPWSVANGFGGIMPQSWAVAVENGTFTFSHNSFDHFMKYQGVYTKV